MISEEMNSLIVKFMHLGNGEEFPGAAISSAEHNESTDTINITFNYDYFEKLETTPITEMPLLINDDEEFVAYYAQWRLDRGF